MKVPFLLLVATLGTVHCTTLGESSYSIIHDRGVRSYFSTPFSHGKTRGYAGFYGQSFAQSNPFGVAGPGSAGIGGGKTCGVPPTNCVRSRYRTFNGVCNNLVNPGWGMAAGSYSRLLSPKYGDGVASPTTSVTGEDLPNARVISVDVFGERDVPDPKYTLLNMQWGQIMTHDMSLQFGGSQAQKHATSCCTDQGRIMEQGNLHSTCYPIIVPPHDPVYNDFDSHCMSFVRTLTDRDVGCPHVQFGAPAEQLTEVTAFLDLSLVYANSDQMNAQLRTFSGGRMITEQRHGREWPPHNPNASTVCTMATGINDVCYLAGDVRVNQNPGLTSLQVMLLTEHNQIADALASINPHWDDERVFQEARRINGAQFQHISYYEWLPIFLGQKNMRNNGLIYETTPGSYVNDYDSSIDPRVINSFATAAFRYFHTQIEGRLDLLSEHRARTASLRLSDWLNRPVIVEAEFDNLCRGMVTQPEEDTDDNIDTEIKHYLFRLDNPIGQDLKAIDIQRNRDHGLASYNDFREFCGLKRATTFEDFLDLISPRHVEKLRAHYTSPEDVDLTVGAALEAHVAGALAGPTFLCILTEQFFRTRVGDRFFYENGNIDSAFTREQLQSIRTSTAARLVCDNTNIHYIQPRAFERIHLGNELQPCASLPRIDFNLWKEEVSSAYNSHDAFFFNK
ncbi:peroxidase [Lutzomyia longipalpis]|uniref:peroxidase n=1 Tax=Lutzomyia longipalpis TaxID=7200 RepID=UPI002483423B|nr:peroxidase [Lutzomyia longipalpis]XP_055676433.1 peroxidase [Lutzomyia longipalpis]XP_055676434.1 peroxidase [Lutzomyia longipalpis]XP_055676435.1 peroxidase [Lutzomyia longipalpis]